MHVHFVRRGLACTRFYLRYVINNKSYMRNTRLDKANKNAKISRCTRQKFPKYYC